MSIFIFRRKVHIWSLFLFASLFSDLSVASTRIGSINVLFLSTYSCQTLSFASSLLSFLFVASSLPLGKPSFRISLVVLNILLHIFGKPHSFFFLYALLGGIAWVLFDLLLDLVLLLSRDMHVLLDELKIGNVTKLFGCLNTSQHLFSLLNPIFLKIDVSNFDLDLRIFGLKGQQFSKDRFLFLKILLVFVDVQQNA